MREDWAECCFEDLLDYEQPTNYIVESTNYNDSFKTPVLTAGKSFILGYTNETTGIFKSLPTIIFDDFTTASQFVDFEFKVKSSAMKILVPTSKRVNLKFVFYFMQVNKVRSDTHKRYWISVFAKNKLQLPPITIQKAIVNKIENLFLNIDKGIADLKTAQEQLKVYRQAVLKKAFEGGFTNKNVKEGELPEGWKWVKLNVLAKVLSGFAFKSTDFSEEGVPVIKIANVGYSEFVKKEQQYLPQSFLMANKDYVIYADDLLIALTRPITNNTTKVCLYPKNIGEGLLNQRVACIKNIITDKSYLFLFFQTDTFKRYIRSKFSETLQPNLSPKDLANSPVPIPPTHTEQHAIVREIESRLSVCDKVEQNIAEALEKAEALRQSILKKAFEGKLLSEAEIAKCKQEADYEPASELLKKIKAEKK